MAAAVIFSAGCAGAVVDAMNEAHKNIETARNAGAEKYAPVTMSIATANYELARDHFIKNTARHNRLAKILALKAAEAARKAETEAREAAAAQEEQRRLEFEAQQRKKAEIRAVEENPDLKAKRYLALAHRRLQFAALSKAGAHPPQDMVEVEVWIAPNGRLTQLIIIQGDPDGLLARTIIHGLQGLQLDPFPEGVKREYLKLRLTIDTRQ